MIRQFDVVRNPVSAWRADKPFLICIQHDFLFESRTRALAALVIPGSVKPTPRLYPQLVVLGQKLILTPDDLVTLGTRQLGKPVTNLKSERERIIAAIDMILTSI